MRYRFHQKIILFFLLCLFFSLAGCAARKPVAPPAIAPLQKVPPSAFPDFSDDIAFDGLISALTQSLSFYERLPEDRPVRFGEDTYTAAHMVRTVQSLRALFLSRPDANTLNRTLKKKYLLYKAAGNPSPGTDLRPEGKVLFTGYYEPHLFGSPTKTKRFSVPLHSLPEDLVKVDLTPFGKPYKGKKITGRWNGKTLVPYPDREAISYRNAINSRAVAWIENRIDRFFLQVQGSGKIYLTDGSAIRVHYHGQNGHPYKSIGKYLIDTGRIPKKEMSMQRIHRYLATHPDEIRHILTKNPSYVFFETVKNGPMGALGVPLTPGRSLAVDRRIFPDGAPVFVRAQKPLLDTRNAISSWTPMERFMTAQDTGGAIRGAGRADIFWGNGSYAEIAAGHLQHPGDLFFLVLAP